MYTGVKELNDSGGLSACYMWNFLGLFPISGQDVVFIGIPQAEKAILHLPNGKTLTITSKSKDKQVWNVVLNGKCVDDYKIPVQELLNGGEIIFS